MWNGCDEAILTASFAAAWLRIAEIARRLARSWKAISRSLRPSAQNSNMARSLWLSAPRGEFEFCSDGMRAPETRSRPLSTPAHAYGVKTPRQHKNGRHFAVQAQAPI